MSEEVLHNKLSNKQHEIWAHWMNYMFSQGTMNDDGSWTMPAEKVERWKRQIDTKYDDLTDDEKKSDQEQVNKFFAEIRLYYLQRAHEAYDRGWISAIETIETALSGMRQKE